MQLLRRNLATVGLALLLVLGAVVAQLASERNPRDDGGFTLGSQDAGPVGTLALALWLEKLGYRIDRSTRGASPTDSVRYLFVLSPARRFARTDARAVIDWVRRGGTLVYVPSLFPVWSLPSLEPGDGLDRELDLVPGVGPALDSATLLTPVLPFFSAPPASHVSVTTTMVLNPSNPAWIPLLEAGVGSRRTVVARRRYGSGQVFAIGSPDFLDNAHLAEADNRAIVLNILARGPNERVVAFDEEHHSAEAPSSLISTARATPWGWSLAYLAVIGFFFALWSGRRFGPPIVRDARPGRSTGDYVTAFAGLLQRAATKEGASGWVQGQYSRLVRRALARTHGVRSDLPAQDLAGILAARRPIDSAELSRHLAALGGPPLGNRGLLETVRSLEPILRSIDPSEPDAGKRRSPPA